MNQFSHPTDITGSPLKEPIPHEKKVSVCRWWRHKYYPTGKIIREAEYQSAVERITEVPPNMEEKQEFQCLICSQIKYKNL